MPLLKQVAWSVSLLTDLASLSWLTSDLRFSSNNHASVTGFPASRRKQLLLALAMNPELILLTVFLAPKNSYFSGLDINMYSDTGSLEISSAEN